MWKVRNIVHQLRAPRKRQKLAENVELVCHEREEGTDEPRRDLQSYILLHFTLMLAYARAGITKLEPQPEVAETAEAESVDYVQVPWDVCLAYHLRLVACASALPLHRALEWVQRKDEEERKMWADKHRASSAPLGRIIKELYERREMAWDISLQAPPPPPPRREPAQGPAPVPRTGTGLVRTGDSLNNGKGICRDYNTGKCTADPCPKGLLHVCNVVTGRGGHVCGMRNHSALTCRRANKGGAAAAMSSGSRGGADGPARTGY